MDSAQAKIDEASGILVDVDMPRAQQNERTALCLLALLDLKPSDKWSNAQAPMIGITPIIEFVNEHYKKGYMPNTRESIRKESIHQFVDAGIAISNPDKPTRAVNSPNWVYQASEAIVKLAKAMAAPTGKTS